MQKERKDRLVDCFKAFLFDMDGVLTDSMPCHFEAWRRVFESFGLCVTQEEILRREGEKGMITLENLLAEQGMRLPRAELLKALEEKQRIFRSLVSPALFPGAQELVHELRKEGKLLALVTGTSASEIRANLDAGFVHCFQAVVTGDRVERGKPDPEPYETALRLLRVSRQEALVIENAPYGIESAKRAGVQCIAVATSLPAQYLRGADGVAHDLGELRSLLFRHHHGT